MKVLPALKFVGDVYRPSDDTWLIIEVIDARKPRGDICLDLGAGTGVLGIYAILNNLCKRVVFIDISEDAVEAVKINLEANNVQPLGIPVLTDYIAIKESAVDVVLANPPYLPIHDPRHVDIATEGGPRGFETIAYFIEYAKETLRSRGRLIMVYSSLSSPRIVNKLVAGAGFKAAFTTKRKFFFETLFATEYVKLS